MNVSTRVRAYAAGGRNGPAVAGRTAAPSRCAGLADELVLPVRLDLEEVELPVQRVVRLRREAEVAAEDPVRDPRPLHVLDQVAALELAVLRDTRAVDRVEDHLDGAVRGRPEGAGLCALVVLLPPGDDRLVVGEQADRRREVGDVRA